MSLIVFLLVVLPASLHVLWNVLVKQSSDKVAFAWLTNVVGLPILLPFFILSRVMPADPNPLGWAVWKWAAVSGIFETCYILLLYISYGKADLSIVYPVSRGIAPVITAMLGYWFIGDAITLWSGAAVGLILLGLVSLSRSMHKPSAQPYDRTGFLLAVATGCAIASYHLVDRRAMCLVPPPSPLEYLFLMYIFLALFLTIGVGAIYPHWWDAIRTEWCANWRGVLIVGAFIPLSYFLIIVAFKYGNVTYITASRNLSIVISTIVGVYVLKEQSSWQRTLGSGLIMAGIIGLVVIG